MCICSKIKSLICFSSNIEDVLTTKPMFEWSTKNTLFLKVLVIYWKGKIIILIIHLSVPQSFSLFSQLIFLPHFHLESLWGWLLTPVVPCLPSWAAISETHHSLTLTAISPVGSSFPGCSLDNPFLSHPTVSHNDFPLFLFFSCLLLLFLYIFLHITCCF